MLLLLRCMSPLMAQSGVLLLRIDISGFGGKAEISRLSARTASAAFDPKRRFTPRDLCTAN